MFPGRVHTRTLTQFFFEKGLCLGHVTPTFWALNANSFNKVKDTDYKFDTHVPKDSPDMNS